MIEVDKKIHNTFLVGRLIKDYDSLPAMKLESNTIT